MPETNGQPERWERVREDTRALPVRLTLEELHAVGDALVTALAAVQAEEAAEKIRREQAKGRLADLVAAQADLAGRYRRGTEERDVACVIERDYAAGVERVRRLDTDEVVGTPRTLRPEERQGELPAVSEAA
jgi:hypothetical protein